MEIIRNKRILAIAGLICLILGIILPYITITFFGISQSVSLWGYWEGKVILVLTIANALFIFKDFIEKYIPFMFNSNSGRLIKNANSKLSLIPTILVVVFAIYLYTSIDTSSSYFKNGVGFYVLWIGVVLLILHAFLYRKKELVNESNAINNQVNLNNSMNNFNQAVNNQMPTNEMTSSPTSVQPNQVNMNGPMPVNNMATPNLNQNQINEPVQMIQGNNKFCPQCGKQVDANATFCPMCGHKF